MSDFTPEEMAQMSADDRKLIEWFDAYGEPADERYGDLPYDDVLDDDGQPVGADDERSTRDESAMNDAIDMALRRGNR